MRYRRRCVPGVALPWRVALADPGSLPLMLPSLAEKEILGPMDGGEGPEGDLTSRVRVRVRVKNIWPVADR